MLDARRAPADVGDGRRLILGLLLGLLNLLLGRGPLLLNGLRRVLALSPLDLILVSRTLLGTHCCFSFRRQKRQWRLARLGGALVGGAAGASALRISSSVAGRWETCGSVSP